MPNFGLVSLGRSTSRDTCEMLVLVFELALEAFSWGHPFQQYLPHQPYQGSEVHLGIRIAHGAIPRGDVEPFAQAHARQ